MTTGPIDPTIFDDPNQVIGETTITRSKYNWEVDFGDGWRYRIRINPAGAQPPVTVVYDSPEAGNWVLDSSPDQWRFASEHGLELPDDFGRLDFIRAMCCWPPSEQSLTIRKNREKLTSDVKGHYLGLTLWLLIRELSESEAKKRLRALLHHPLLVHLKPYADISFARREFAYQIYSRSEVAQRAQSEDHLWFCLEYSSCLQKINNSLGKVECRVKNTNAIKLLKQALNDHEHKFDFSKNLTTESLQTAGEDWRLSISDLLVQDAIRLCWEDDGDTEDLKHHVDQYLNALRHYNVITGNCKPHAVLCVDPNGEVRESRKGQKKTKGFAAPLLHKGRM